MGWMHYTALVFCFVALASVEGNNGIGHSHSEHEWNHHDKTTHPDNPHHVETPHPHNVETHPPQDHGTTHPHDIGGISPAHAHTGVSEAHVGGGSSTQAAVGSVDTTFSLPSITTTKQPTYHNTPKPTANQVTLTPTTSPVTPKTTTDQVNLSTKTALPLTTQPKPASATCTNCSALECLMNAPLVTCDPGVTFCLTTIEDDKDGRVITRGCANKAKCDSIHNEADCENIENDPLSNSTLCQFCCHGFDCNHAPQLLPDSAHRYTKAP